MPIAPEDKSSIPLRRCPGASIQIRRISKTVRFPYSNWIPTKSGRKRSTVFYGIPGEGPERSASCEFHCRKRGDLTNGSYA